MNRNYWDKPIQHSRSTHDYGNSGPILPCDDLYPVSWRERIVASAIILAITFTLVALAAA